MVFDVNQTAFTSDYQREVWRHGIHVIPLAVSLENISDPEMREGCTQVYHVTMEMLADMYEHPQDYDRTKSNDYLELFFRWHAEGKRRVPVNVQKQKGLYAHILDRLERFGFMLEGETLTNSRYPLFLPYRDLLNASFDYGSTIPCDFRLLVKPYKRTTDDLLRPLPDIYKPLWRDLFTYAVMKGAKLKPRKDYLFCWAYQKQAVLVLHPRPPHVEVSYQMGGDLRPDFAVFLDLARGQPDADALIRYIRDNLCICDSCGGSKTARQRCLYTHWVDIDGKRRLAASCHVAIGRTKHNARREPYTTEDVHMLKRMMDLRFLQIEGGPHAHT